MSLKHPASSSYIVIYSFDNPSHSQRPTSSAHLNLFEEFEISGARPDLQLQKLIRPHELYKALIILSLLYK